MEQKLHNDALEYHKGGKVATLITKPCETQYDLSLAYTPGVAIPCREIQRDPSLAYKSLAVFDIFSSIGIISNNSINLLSFFNSALFKAP